MKKEKTPDSPELPEGRAFVTGSRAYGTPRVCFEDQSDCSDLDLVALVTEKDLERIRGFADEVGLPQPECAEEYAAAGGFPFNFGGLNLIVCVDPRMFEVWKAGTRKLKRKAPVSREAAIKFMAKLRRDAGFHVVEPREKLYPGDDGVSIPF